MTPNPNTLLIRLPKSTKTYPKDAKEQPKTIILAEPILALIPSPKKRPMVIVTEKIVKPKPAK